MRKILEILRLHFEGKLSGRAIARSVCVAVATVQDCLRRFLASGLKWPLEVDENELEGLMYPAVKPGLDLSLPDFRAVQATLMSHKAMTRRHVWERYRAEQPEGLGYSAFCAKYSQFVAAQKVVMRQSHPPGLAMLVDYAGPGLVVIDPCSGKETAVRLFVAVLGYSNYTFAMATRGETTADWLSAQVAALEAFSGVPETVVPDNPKALVTRACQYEPDLNPAYQDFARHYGVAVLPARVRKPRDKAKVETAVQIVERHLMPTLLAQRFFSLAALNEVIAAMVKALNAKSFQKLEGSRASWFAEEQKVLRPLPTTAYEFADWKRAKVHLDYHVEVDGHWYSVPHIHCGKQVDVRIGARTVQIFLRGKQIAVHERILRKRGFSTIPEHRPPNHQNMADQSIERLYRQAEAIGPSTAQVMRRLERSRKHPHEVLRSALGIVRLAKDFSSIALEEASARALQLNTINYKSLRNLIEHPPINMPAPPRVISHDNVRGSSYFAGVASC